eukprot:14235_1
MILLFYIIQTNKFIFYCHNAKVSHVFGALDVQIYIFQMLILLGILFYRVWIVFTNSTFELSIATIRFFVALYIFTWIDLILFGVLSAAYWLFDVWLIDITAYVIIAATGSCCIFVLNVSLIYLFIYKLVQAFKSLSNNRDNLLQLITKTSLLFFVSTLTLLLFVISPPLRNLRSVHWDFVCDVVLIGDVYANFMCIWLSYQFADDYYDKICGVCHRKCYGCCSKSFDSSVKKDKPPNRIERVASNASQSTASSPRSMETVEI